MVSSLSVVRDLSEVFGTIGIFGAGVAVLCAVIALIAIAGNHAGVLGMAVGGWIVGALLSLSASFAKDWMPVTVAGVALVIALVAGLAVRLVVQSFTRRATPVG